MNGKIYRLDTPNTSLLFYGDGQNVVYLYYGKKTGEITPETERAIKEITVFIGLLSDYYIKDRTEGLKFDDDDM